MRLEWVRLVRSLSSKKWREMSGYETGPTGVRKVRKVVVVELQNIVTFRWWLCSGCELARRVDVGK